MCTKRSWSRLEIASSSNVRCGKLLLLLYLYRGNNVMCIFFMRGLSHTEPRKLLYNTSR